MKREGQVRLSVIPCTTARAQAFVEAVHRHHGPVPGGYAFWSLAALDCDGSVRGVAIVGRPTNRNNDTGQVVEVLRLASDGCPNAPSKLLGAAARVAKEAGASAVITYTLETESGLSLRAAGWAEEKRGIKSWWTHQSGAADGRVVRPREHYGVAKVRWARRFREPVDVSWPAARQGEVAQGALF